MPANAAYCIRVLDLREVVAIEGIDAGPDLGAKCLQSEAVFLPTLLEYAQGVTDSFAGILVLASFDDLLNKRVLLGG
jgi:hypothetical protein